MSKQSGQQFDLSKVHDNFVTSYDKTSETIRLRQYLDAWRELCKFLDTLGTLFHFVTNDVLSKVHIMEDYMSKKEMEYSTVNSLLDYEVQNKLTTTKTPSGSRTLLRLHRALSYLLRLFDSIVQADLAAKVSTLSIEAYQQTLGKYHPWIVRKAAGLAMYSLPHKNGLLQRIDASAGGEERVTGLLRNITESGTPLYDFMEHLYAKDDLLELP